MYKLLANFSPAAEEKNGYIGKADVTVADAIRINGISVFKNQDGTYSFRLPEHNGKYKNISLADGVSAAMVDAIGRAVEAENHFSVVDGERSVRMVDYENEKANLTIAGKAVKEPYADGRYTMELAGFGTFSGITTHVVPYEKDGEKRTFVSVDMPKIRNVDGTVRMSTNADGKEVATEEFTGIIRKSLDANGEEHPMDWAQKIADAIRFTRREVLNLNKDASLDGKIAGAEAQRDESAPAKNAPTRDVAEQTH